jgi:hypothetical protein
MITALVINIVAIIAIALVIAVAMPKDAKPEGVAFAFIAAVWLVGASFWGWVIYVGVHFLSKYW